MRPGLLSLALLLPLTPLLRPRVWAASLRFWPLVLSHVLTKRPLHRSSLQVVPGCLERMPSPPPPAPPAIQSPTKGEARAARRRERLLLPATPHAYALWGPARALRRARPAHAARRSRQGLSLCALYSYKAAATAQPRGRRREPRAARPPPPACDRGPHSPRGALCIIAHAAPAAQSPALADGLSAARPSPATKHGPACRRPELECPSGRACAPSLCNRRAAPPRRAPRSRLHPPGSAALAARDDHTQ